MRAWHRSRSAPLGVLTVGAIALLATMAAVSLFYVSVVRRARGLPAYTVGMPRAMVAHPLQRRAAYEVFLEGPAGRTTPAGTPSIAHRWRVIAPAAPDDALCEGSATDGLEAVDASGRRAVTLPVPLRFYLASVPRPVPARVLATCPSAFPAMQRAGSLEYVEEYVPPHISVEIAACATHREDDAALGVCDDGAPSRIFPREPRDIARARTRGAMFRVSGCAAAFALVCFAAGLAALRRFDRSRRGV